MRKWARGTAIWLTAVLIAQLLLAAGLPAGKAAAGASDVTYTVNTFADAVDANVGDGVCGDGNTAGDGSPECTLRAAIQEANAQPSVAVAIELPAGTYVAGVFNGPNGEDNSLAGDFDIKGNVNIVGPSSGEAIIAFTTGSGPVDRVFQVFAGATLRVSDVTIEGGYVGMYGGGILNEGTLTLERVKMTGNSAGYGGALANRGSATLIDCDLTGNGSPFTGSGWTPPSDYSYNSLEAAAILQYGDDSSVLTLTGTTIENNEAYATSGGSYGIGGGVVLSGGTVTIEDSVISGNRANYYGGLLATGGRVTLNHVQIADNHSAKEGGGLGFGGGDLTVLDSEISGNSTDGDGGGIAISENSIGNARIESSVISGNQAGGEGGALYAHPEFVNNGVPSPRNVTLQHDQITGNKTQSGDGSWSETDLISNQSAFTAINAAPNWWGSAEGPGPSAFSGSVDSIPWCADSSCSALVGPSDELQSLTVSVGQLSPAFNHAVTFYSLYAGSANTLDVTATGFDPDAAIAIGGKAAVSGQPQSVALQPGYHEIEITVTIPGQPVKTYTLGVTRAAADFRPGFVSPSRTWDFRDPEGVATIGSDVFVADTGNNRVVKLSDSGNVEGIWDQDGSGGTFTPQSIAASPDGQSIYVGDSNGHRILVFSPDGELLSKWPVQNGGQSANPAWIAVDNDGNVYITSYSFIGIWKFDKGGNFLAQNDAIGQVEDPGAISVNSSVYYADPSSRQIVYLDSNLQEQGSLDLSGVDPFAWFGGIASDSTGHLYVNDLHGQILVSDDHGDWHPLLNGASGGSSLGRPAGISVSATGRVWVTDTMYDQVLSFDGGDLTAAWGTHGTAPGYFNYPEAVEAAPSGRLYVADSGNYRIDVLDAQGHYLSSIGQEGEADGQFESTDSVAVSPKDGSLFVADTGNHRVSHFDSQGTFLKSWPVSGSGVAVDSEGNVYAVDGDHHQIVKLETDGSTTLAASNPDSGNPWYPNGIAIGPDSSGEAMYVTDSGNRVFKLDMEGNLLKTWGSAGSDAGQFNWPQGIAVDSDGYVYVADSGNNRFQMFDSDGRYLGQWGNGPDMDKPLKSPEGITIDARGNVYAADTYNHRIVQFIRANASAIAGITVDPASLSLKLGSHDSQQLKVTVSMSDGTTADVTAANAGTAYASSDSAVATVTADGYVEAKGAGEATIAVSYGGFDAQVNVTVDAADTQPEPSPSPSPSPSPAPNPGTVPPADNGQPGVCSVHVDGRAISPLPAETAAGGIKLRVSLANGDNAPELGQRQPLGPMVELAGVSDSQLKQNIRLTVCYDASRLQANEKPALYYYNRLVKRWIEIGGTPGQDGTITAETGKLAVYAVFPAQPSVSFRDMNGNWASAYAERLSKMNIITGYEDGSFLPDRPITRAEFARMLALALGLTASGSSVPFADRADIPSWAADPIDAIVSAGIAQGFNGEGGTVFQPQRTITRAEMAVMIIRALNELRDQTSSGAEASAAEAGAPTPFSDQAEIPQWAAEAVKEAARLGFVSGLPDGTFRPGGSTTRAAAAKLICKLLDELGI